MVAAVCMINVDLGKEISVRRELSMFEGVKELLHLFGEYDRQATFGRSTTLWTRSVKSTA